MKAQVRIPENEIFDSRQQSVSRRDFLKVGVSSFLGLIAMQHLQSSAWTPLGGIAARAKHCIVLFMNGGASQLDTFDPKPDTLNAGPFAAIPTRGRRHSVLRASAAAGGTGASSVHYSVDGFSRGKS